MTIDATSGVTAGHFKNISEVALSLKLSVLLELYF
jgi:hypothetical protein